MLLLMLLVLIVVYGFLGVQKSGIAAVVKLH